ncbi:DUF2911 domain-containing protein [bacterium SCSIO 12741]|nr:DUF2911 domain-containing protein [bacterium SCSIO 12741]
MKQIISLFTVAFLMGAAFINPINAQDKSERKSPPMTTNATVGGVNVTINYSSPAVKGRTVWGDLVPYDKVWRTGANEATTFEIDKNLMVEGKKLPKGKYSLFTIPGEKQWVIIFNAQPDQWGAYKYKEKEDVLRVTVRPVPSAVQVENLAIEIEDGMLVIKWDNLMIPARVSAK